MTEVSQLHEWEKRARAKWATVRLSRVYKAKLTEIGKMFEDTSLRQTVERIIDLIASMPKEMWVELAQDAPIGVEDK